MKLLLILIFFPCLVFANGRGGNGGTSLECFKEKTDERFILLWDLIEFGPMRFQKEINQKNDPYEDAYRLIYLYSKKDPVYGEELLSEYSYYMSMVKRHSGDWDSTPDEISDIDSSYSFPSKIPGFHSCQKVYPAFFVMDYPVLYARYYLNESMMAKMPYEHQVALIIHEVVYAHFINQVIWGAENDDLSPEMIVLLAPRILMGGVKGVRSKVRKIMETELILPGFVPYPNS